MLKDNKVEIELDLPIDTIVFLEKEAAKLGITVDAFVEKILKEQLNDTVL